jgi:SagB-type dehydrogenase family enzyme
VKSYGAQRWALRCNPSSGNLHPTEGYLLCPRLTGLSAGVYHYLSRDHVLERRAAVDDPVWTEAFSGKGVLIGISSIHWREAWKYGLRAWRYCQHDCGHALAAVSYAAAALGWQTRLVHSAADETVARLLGIDRHADFGPAEAEVPDALLWVGNPDARPDVEQLLIPLGGATWYGRANKLSHEQVRWPDIDSIQRATHKPATQEPPAPVPVTLPPPSAPDLDLTFAKIARQRRSALGFDGRTRITDASFFTMLECLLVRRRATLECMAGSRARASRVDGAPCRWPGAGSVHVLRDPDALPGLKHRCAMSGYGGRSGRSICRCISCCPMSCETLPSRCCHQDIGADSCLRWGCLRSPTSPCMNHGATAISSGVRRSGRFSSRSRGCRCALHRDWLFLR